MRGRLGGNVGNDWPAARRWSQHQRRAVELRAIKQGDPEGKMRNDETGDRHGPSSVDLPPGEQRAPRPIIEHMFYYRKGGKNRRTRLESRMNGHSERSPRHAAFS